MNVLPNLTLRKMSILHSNDEFVYVCGILCGKERPDIVAYSRTVLYTLKGGFCYLFMFFICFCKKIVYTYTKHTYLKLSMQTKYWKLAMSSFLLNKLLYFDTPGTVNFFYQFRNLKLVHMCIKFLNGFLRIYSNNWQKN